MILQGGEYFIVMADEGEEESLIIPEQQDFCGRAALV